MHKYAQMIWWVYVQTNSYNTKQSNNYTFKYFGFFPFPRTSPQIVRPWSTQNSKMSNEDQYQDEQ